MPLPEMGNYLLVAVAAAGYWAWANRAALRAYLTPSKAPVAPAESDPLARRDEWVSTLLRLQRELDESGQSDLSALTRELVWQLLGGKPHKG